MCAHFMFAHKELARISHRASTAMAQRRGLVTLVGVDGCRGGWVAATLRLGGAGSGIRNLSAALYSRFPALLKAHVDAAVVAIDMPIGLLPRAQPGGRACDQAARKRLGRGRASTVFSPPARKTLKARSYRHALELNQLGISKQTFNLFPRIRELDALITHAEQTRLFEAHPELAFMHLAGEPLSENKKTAAGISRRKALLTRIYGAHMLDPAVARAELGRAEVHEDDILDACVLCNTAWRIFTNQAVCLGDGQADRRGLRMGIWY